MIGQKNKMALEFLRNSSKIPMIPIASGSPTWISAFYFNFFQSENCWRSRLHRNSDRKKHGFSLICGNAVLNPWNNVVSRAMQFLSFFFHTFMLNHMNILWKRKNDKTFLQKGSKVVSAFQCILIWSLQLQFFYLREIFLLIQLVAP